MVADQESETPLSRKSSKAATVPQTHQRNTGSEWPFDVAYIESKVFILTVSLAWPQTSWICIIGGKNKFKCIVFLIAAK